MNRELLSLAWKLPLAIVLGILLWLLQLVHWGSGELIKLIGDPWEMLAGQHEPAAGWMGTASASQAPPPAGPSEEAMQVALLVERLAHVEFDGEESDELVPALARAIDRLAGRGRA